MMVWIKSTNGDLTSVTSVFKPVEAEPNEWVIEAHPAFARGTNFAVGVYDSREEAVAAFDHFEQWLARALAGEVEEGIFEF